MKEGDTLGHTLREMIPGVPGQIMDAFAQVVETGEPAQFEFAVPAPRLAWYEARARREGENQMMALFLDVTARKTAESELWEGQHRKNFVLALGDRMREQQHQPAIEQLACESLGQHLALGLVALVDWEGGGAEPRVSTCWRPLLGRDGCADLDLAFDDAFLEAVRGGRTAFMEPLLAQPNGDIMPSAIVVPTGRWGGLGRAGRAADGWHAAQAR
ncbi:PAS domain-containing protein [Achromobacter insuavis]